MKKLLAVWMIAMSGVLFAQPTLGAQRFPRPRHHHRRENRECKRDCKQAYRDCKRNHGRRCGEIKRDCDRGCRR